MTIEEMRYLVISLLNNLVRPLSFYICKVEFFGCGVCFDSAIARKGTSYSFPQNRIIYSNRLGLPYIKIFPDMSGISML